MAYDNLNPSFQWGQVGSTEMPGTGNPSIPMFGLRGYSDQYLLGSQKQKFDEGMQTKKFGMVQGMLNNFMGGGGFGSGSSSFSSPAWMPPRPSYMNAGPVWSQGQIDAQAGLQRAGLMTQAAGQTQQFANQLGNRGFSPLNPLAGMVGNMNTMRANAGAAQNETQLNFNAAKANSDAKLQAGGINAGMYGDWVKSMLGAQQMHADSQYHSQQLNQQLLGQLLSALG